MSGPAASGRDFGDAVGPAVGEERFVETGGPRLRALLDGPPEAAPLLVLHGFTGSAESMGGVAERLRDRFRVVRLELVGHGDSEAPREPGCYAMDACARQIRAAAGALGLERPHLLGYSMGGRAALASALQAPDAFASLTLVGATAGIADPEARRERIAADEALAARIEREGLERFVDEWMALPLFAGQARLGPAFLAESRAQRLRSDPIGLANSLRGMGAGAQAPLHDRLARFEGPVLLVVGALDAKFRDIAASLAADLPDARIRLVEDAGHAAHLESPDAFADIVARFLDGVEADRASSAPRDASGLGGADPRGGGVERGAGR